MMVWPWVQNVFEIGYFKYITSDSETKKKSYLLGVSHSKSFILIKIHYNG